MTSTQEYYDYKNTHGEFKQAGLMSVLRKLLITFEENRIDITIRNFPNKSNKYLDIGCNNSKLILDLRSKYKHAVGVDISPKILANARKNVQEAKLSDKIEFQKVDIDNGLPFRSNSFDVVTVIAVLEHLFDPIALLKEAYRVLRKGGALMIEVPNVAWFPHRFGLLFGKRPRTSYDPGWEGGHLQYFTFHELENVLEEIGFKVVKRDCSGIFRNLKNIYLPLLSADIFLVCKK